MRLRDALTYMEDILLIGSVIACEPHKLNIQGIFVDRQPAASWAA